MDNNRGFRLGPWAVSPLTGEIESEGRIVHLEPKVMEVLVALAGQSETLVLRDDLLNQVWGPRAAISDEPLTRCIAQLRQALGDSSRDPKFIQTVPKRGYRLIVPALPLDVPSNEAAGGHRPWHRPWRGIGMIGALAAVGLAAYLALPLMFDDTATADACRIEQREQPLRTIDSEALELCRDGVDEMEERTVSSIGFAIDYFRQAIEREPGYGSAIINLARSMVLLPSYDDRPDPRACSYDSRIADPSDCYEAALRLLDLYIVDAPYIQDYIYGIKGYIYTQQRQWRLAAAQFDRARNETPDDPDMWQWRSQFLASVGELDGALDSIETAFGLNPNSAVILDRYGVVLMWLGRYDQAAIRFDEARQHPHVPFEASQLVWSIRSGQWDEVRQLLARHAGSRRDAAAWIDVFLAGLEDSAARAPAVAAVETAIQANELSGQYIYGAWALLEQPDRAIDAALRLIDDDPNAMTVEFLFAPETKAMRQHARFGLLVEALDLNDYWSAGGANCPGLFERADERNWCG